MSRLLSVLRGGGHTARHRSKHKSKDSGTWFEFIDHTLAGRNYFKQGLFGFLVAVFFFFTF